MKNFFSLSFFDFSFLWKGNQRLYIPRIKLSSIFSIHRMLDTVFIGYLNTYKPINKICIVKQAISTKFLFHKK